MACNCGQCQQDSFNVFMAIIWMLIIVFGGGWLLLSHVSFGGVESTTYLGHDEQVQDGHVINTGE